MPKIDKRHLLAILLIIGFAGIPLLLPSDDHPAVQISEQRRTHILYGDKTGGGHLHGVGKPCKSEFPADWSSEEIVETVQSIAANDNLNWKSQRNGYAVAEQMVEGIRVRVVLDRNRQDVVTAYPVNVMRNPCPAANDNNRD